VGSLCNWDLHLVVNKAKVIIGKAVPCFVSVWGWIGVRGEFLILNYNGQRRQRTILAMYFFGRNRWVNRVVTFIALSLLLILFLILIPELEYEGGEFIDTRDPNLGVGLRLLAPCVPKRLLLKDKNVDGGSSLKDQLKKCGVIRVRLISFGYVVLF
jgi:hypothetical protein